MISKNYRFAIKMVQIPKSYRVAIKIVKLIHKSYRFALKPFIFRNAIKNFINYSKTYDFLGFFLGEGSICPLLLLSVEF